MRMRESQESDRKVKGGRAKGSNGLTRLGEHSSELLDRAWSNTHTWDETEESAIHDRRELR